MLILNLANTEKSDIKYKIFDFPDGECQIELLNLNRKVDIVEIKTRISSMRDLFLLQQVGDILNRQEILFKITIYYLMGMRMDRVMDFNRPFTLKIIADTINALKPRKVITIEPHSEKTIDLINSCESYSVINLDKLRSKYMLVFPDAGAVERYSHFDDINQIECKKVRDIETGKLKSFEIINPGLVHNSSKPLMIVDDLCDGGGTFLGIAKAIREINPEISLHITVTHMVNHIGIKNLSNNFDTVTITNSYKDWYNLPDNINLIDII